MGSIEQPLNPIAVALAAEATFVARSIDAHTQHLGEVLAQAAAHKGTSFVEVYQNCVIFNPTEWEGLDDRRVRDENILYLAHGQPMVFGKNRDKGIRLNGFEPEVVQLGNGVGEEDLLVHDATSTQLAYILSSMAYPAYPVPMGVIRQVQKQTYSDGLLAQVQQARAERGAGDLNKLYRTADLWTVTAREPVKPEPSGQLSLELDEEYVDEMEHETEVTTVIQDRLTEDPIAALEPNVPITVDASTSLAKAIRQMNAHNIGCLLVTDANDELVGIFTERDVLMRVAGLVEDLSQVTVGDYMTSGPLAVTADLPVAHALYLMSVHGFRHLPLVDEANRPEGIISFRDVIRYLKQNFS
jgi:CBS domain-containing protein